MTTPSLKPRSARKGSLKPAQLTGYLAGTVGTAALLAGAQAEAAVTAVNFGFGPVYDTSDSATSLFSVGGFGQINAYSNSLRLRIGSSFVISGVFQEGAVYHNNAWSSTIGKVSFFENGTVIGNGTNGGKGAAWFQYPTSDLDLTANQTNKNIAFMTTTNNYGWANVSWNESAKSLTVHSAYVESVAGNSITVGVTNVPEPSRALLALAGLGGVALRRRRKQAA